eukprot:XP_001707256.1 Hypothetical protein GL50803_32381 [Giardia lamblia ATCC 50803]
MRPASSIQGTRKMMTRSGSSILSKIGIYFGSRSKITLRESTTSSTAWRNSVMWPSLCLITAMSSSIVWAGILKSGAPVIKGVICGQLFKNSHLPRRSSGAPGSLRAHLFRNPQNKFDRYTFSLWTFYKR